MSEGVASEVFVDSFFFLFPLVAFATAEELEALLLATVVLAKGTCSRSSFLVCDIEWETVFGSAAVAGPATSEQLSLLMFALLFIL